MLSPFDLRASALADALGFRNMKIRGISATDRNRRLVTWLPMPANPKMTGLRLVEEGFDLWLEEARIEFRISKVMLTSEHPIIEARVFGVVAHSWLYSIAEFDSRTEGFVANALERGQHYDEAEEIREHQSAISTGHGRIYGD